MIGSKDLAPNNLDAVGDKQSAVKLKDAKQELFNLRSAQATGQLEDYGRIKAARRDVACIYTTYQERRLGIRTEPSVEE